MRMGEMLHQVEADPRAADLTLIDIIINLVEALEDAFTMPLGDAQALVDHVYAHCRAFVGGDDLHRAPLGE